MVYLEECELAKQLHPKENDLVFLVPERLNGEKDVERNRAHSPVNITAVMFISSAALQSCAVGNLSAPCPSRLKISYQSI